MRYLRLVCPDGIEKTGYRIEGNRLEPPPRQAPTVRVWKGKALTTDGPFAETKEQVGVTNVSSTLDAGLDGLLTTRVTSVERNGDHDELDR